MAQNIRSTISTNKILASNLSYKEVSSFYSPIKGFDEENSNEVKRKLLYNEQPVMHPVIRSVMRPVPDPRRERNDLNTRSRYLDLFTQLNIIEDSFEFVRLSFHFDPFQCVYAGSSFEKIYGYSCKDIYERTDIFYEAAHPDDAEFLKDQIDILIANGYNEFTYRIITKNSEVKFLKVNAWCQQDENGANVISCYQKDVSTRMLSGSQLKKNLKKYHFVSDIAITLNSIDDFQHKLQQAVNKMGDSVQADQVSLYEIDGEYKRMTCRYIWTKQDIITPSGITFNIPPLGNLPDHATALQYNIDENVTGFMSYWHKPHQVKSLMIVPVRIKQRFFGFIELCTVQEKRIWTDDDFSFVGTVGNMVANFYDRKAINDELNLNYLKQELLANVSYRLNKYTDDHKQVIKHVLGYIGSKKPDTERIFIYKYQEEGRCFKKTHEYVTPLLNPKYGSRDDYGTIFFEEIVSLLKMGQSYCVNDISQLKPVVQSMFRELNLKSFLLTPLFVNGQFYGIYGYGIYSHYHTWKKTEIEIAQSFAGTISHFIERQTIMRKLESSEKKFKDISSKLPGCVFQATCSPAGKITVNYISPQFEQWLPTMTVIPFSLETVQKSIHPSDYDSFEKLKKELELPHSEVSFEGRFYFPVVGFKWLIIKATVSEIQASGERTYNGLLIDVTENKQTELKLAEANVSIHSIINNLEAGILLVDDQDNVLYTNDRLVDMMVSAGVWYEVMEHPGQILNATHNLVIDSDDLRRHTDELIEKRVEERGRELFFYRSAEYATRDYIPVFRDNRFFAHLFIFNNVTHIKQQDVEIQKAYKRVRTIIDYSDIGVLLLNENEKILIVNEQFLKMYRIKEPASYFVNQLFEVLWEKMNLDTLIDGIDIESIRNAIHSGKRILNREVKINEIGTLKWFIDPVIDDRQIPGKTREILIQSIDITAQKNIEQTLRRAKEEAEVIAKAKSHILMAMSHEIRTPLNGILGFSTMLKDTLSDPYHREMAEVIDQSGQRLMETLNAILDFSVIQSDKKAYKFTSVSANHIIQEQINLYRTMASQKKLYLYAEIKGRISIVIAEQALYKILQNLVSNAIKYTVRGGVKIEACITNISDKEWIELKVIDTGVGIDELMHKTIFEPFRQESEGYGRAFEGTGLGLSLVKEYVKKMGGKVSLISQKDAGSTFTILLPNAYYDNNDTSSEIIGLLPKHTD